MTGLTRGLGAIDGNFQSTLELQEADLKATPQNTVFVNDGSTIQFYDISDTDDGSAVALNNGLFANPVTTGASMYIFNDADAAVIGFGTNTTITAVAGERVVISRLSQTIGGGGSLWSLVAGTRTIFSSGDIVLDDASPTLAAGSFSAVPGNSATSGPLVFGDGESVTITNGEASGSINVVWQIQVKDS